MKTEVIDQKQPTPDELRGTQLNVQLPKGVVKELRIIASEEGRTISSLALEGLLFILEGYHGSGGKYGHPFVKMHEGRL